MTDTLFMLDSNICIYVLADGDCAAARRLGEYSPGSVVVSAIAYGEVLRGTSSGRPGEVDMVNRLFAVVPIVAFDDDAALKYREIPFQRGSVDRLIAAHALSLGLTLVTNNEGDFADVPGLKIENWTL